MQIDIKLNAPFSHDGSSFFRNTFSQGMNILSRWIERKHQRKSLAKLDLRLLNDIAITPDQVRQEISKPFWK